MKTTSLLAALPLIVSLAMPAMAHELSRQITARDATSRDNMKMHSHHRAEAPTALRAPTAPPRDEDPFAIMHFE